MSDERSTPTAIGTGPGLVVLAVLSLLVMRSAPDWVVHMPEVLLSVAKLPPARALTIMAAAVGTGALAGGAAVAWLRALVTRRTLASRVSYMVLAADDFDPSEEAVLRAAAQLSRVRRAVLGWLDPAASAVRVRLDSGADGRMLYRIQVARRARSVVAAAFGSLGNLELREELPTAADVPALKHVARAELVLARPSCEPLAMVGLSPDPLQLFAHAFASVREHEGECASVVLDLLPAAAGQRRRLRGQLLAQARSSERPGRAGVLGVFLAVLFPSRGQETPLQQPLSLSDQVERRADARQLASKVLEHDPLFELQVLVRAGARTEERAHGHLEALLSCFDAFSGQNWFRVAGFNLLGLAFRGADASEGSRRRFDRRFRSGQHRPSRHNLVTAREIGALLKPPSKHCQAPNVLRLGGSVPPPPPGLPTFRRQPGLLPLGRISDGDGGQRLIGIPLADTFFTYFAGRSRYGKTETAINQFLHLVRTGHGGLFLDPHEDALQRIKAHLTEPELAGRIVEINLAGKPDHVQVSWNLFSMKGLGPDDIEKKVAAIVDSFASVLGWDERAARAMNLVTQAAQTLLELALRLPPELAPNIFTTLSLLSNDLWRKEMLGHFSPAAREFWKQRFPRLPAEAITPVTNLVDRMRASRTIAALFGAPLSGYDIRRAMDSGKIVLACPGAGGLQQNRLVANLLVYDLLHAALTRAELAVAKRLPFFAFIDEAQICDGASNGNLAALLEQCAKFGLRLFLFNQDPERLTARTWSAIKTNRSHLLTTVVSAEAAVMLARQWGGDIHPATITRLPRFSYVASVTLDREISRPFMVAGVPVSEMWEGCHHPERLDAVDAIISRNTGRTSTASVLAKLDGHDKRILAYLRADERGRPVEQADDDPAPLETANGS
jgi:hypothetical protein